MPIKKNILDNGVASVLQKIVKVFQQLLLVPFFISSWGAEYYGEWITLTIIPSILALSDFGFGSAASNTFVLKFAAGLKKEAKNISKAGLVVITGAICFAVIMSFILLYVLDSFGVFDKSLIEKNELVLAVLAIMFTRIFNFYYQFYGGYFRAARRSALGINLITVYESVTLIACFIVLIFDGGVVPFALANLIIALLFNPYYAWKANRVIDFDDTESGVLLKKDIKQITKKGLGYLMSPAWQAIYFQGTTFVVRITIGATGVTVFNTIRTVTRSINQIFNIVNSSVFPEIQFEMGKGNLKNVRKIFVTSLLIVFVTAFLGCLFLFFFGQDFYELWTKKQLNPPVRMWNIFIVGIIFNAIWFASGVVFNAFNKPYKYAFAGLIGSIISVISSYFLCKSYGLVGAALGSVMLDIIMFFYVLPTSCSLIGQSIKKLLPDMVTQTKAIYLTFKRRYILSHKK